MLLEFKLQLVAPYPAAAGEGEPLPRRSVAKAGSFSSFPSVFGKAKCKSARPKKTRILAEARAIGNPQRTEV